MKVDDIKAMSDNDLQHKYFKLVQEVHDLVMSNAVWEDLAEIVELIRDEMKKRELKY